MNKKEGLIAEIDINDDDDFMFITTSGEYIQFPIKIPCSSYDEGKTLIRDWIWDNHRLLYVKNSAERQKDHIKLHKHKMFTEVEEALERMYSWTYTNHSSYYLDRGNWTFSWGIKEYE
jgi:hypothetical protein